MAEGLGEWYKLYVEVTRENERLRYENYVLRHKYEACLRKKTIYKSEMKRNSAKLARLHKFFRDSDVFKEL